MKAEILGLFFNRVGGDTPTSEDAPGQELTIEKDVLDRSSGEIQGRLAYSVDSPYQLVWSVEMDGKYVSKGTLNIPPGSGSGIIDTSLFHYPNSAAAGKSGKHIVKIQVGLRKAFWQDLWNLSLPSVEWFSTATFPITLLPNSPRD